ncbi:MAG: pilus assembly protein [Firmicutes bacterium]|nr:pilus assembly protein [Bacillota bacterium]MDD4264078.1 pilus assembly protein [Bacillota bacterium]MDD4694174.1 pilus assembly protein [Bacillota bacterium]
MYLYFSNEGQSLVELAFLLPAFVILLLAVFFIGQYFNMQLCLDMAVSAALRAESFGYNGKKVFYEEWKNLTGKDKNSVEFRITRYAQVVTAYGSLEIEMPTVYQNFNLPNPKVESKLTQIFGIVRL